MTLTWWSHKHFQLEARPFPGFCDHGCCKTQRTDKQGWVHTHTHLTRGRYLSLTLHTHTLWAEACGCILWSERGNWPVPEESEGCVHTHTQTHARTHGACGVKKATSRCHLWFSVTRSQSDGLSARTRELWAQIHQTELKRGKSHWNYRV